jgi:hypothetical protein
MSGQEREAQFAEAADWLIRCLQDVLEHKVVRGLPEAEGAYLQARAALAAREDTERPDEREEMLDRLEHGGDIDD